MSDKIWIEDLVREIDKEQREEGPELDMAKIADRAEREMERRRFQKREKVYRRIIASVIFVAVLTVSFSTFSLDESFAIFFRELFSREELNDQTNSNNFVEGEGETDYRIESLNLEELESFPDILVSLPEYLPGDYEFGSAEATYFFDELIEVAIYYDSYENVNSLMYTIAPLENKKAKTIHIDIEKDKLYSMIEDTIEYQYTNNTNANLIFWDRQELFYTIRCDLPGEELVKVALSIDLMGEI